MPTALIADDEPHLAAYLREALRAAWPQLHVVHVASNGDEAAAKIVELEPDVAFLDIKMPGLSGLEVAQGIEGSTRVVFVTAYDEYAVSAFEQNAIDYLLKPVKSERLAKTVERLRAALAGDPAAAGEGEDFGDPRLATALRRLLSSEEARRDPGRLRHVRASHGEQVRHIDVDDVLFFHADDKYTCVRTAEGEHLIRTTITELAAQLDADRFAQVHRSTIVNLDKVESTRRDETSRLFVRMRGVAAELPVSRAYVHLFKAM